eukprot:scaffold3489_cov145-Pinguiococcus_pyrenoidosus.AAC.1
MSKDEVLMELVKEYGEGKLRHDSHRRRGYRAGGSGRRWSKQRLVEFLTRIVCESVLAASGDEDVQVELKREGVCDSGSEPCPSASTDEKEGRTEEHLDSGRSCPISRKQIERRDVIDRGEFAMEVFRRNGLHALHILTTHNITHAAH